MYSSATEPTALPPLPDPATPPPRAVEGPARGSCAELGRERDGEGPLDMALDCGFNVEDEVDRAKINVNVCKTRTAYNHGALLSCRYLGSKLLIPKLSLDEYDVIRRRDTCGQSLSSWRELVMVGQVRGRFLTITLKLSKVDNVSTDVSTLYGSYVKNELFEFHIFQLHRYIIYNCREKMTQAAHMLITVKFCLAMLQLICTSWYQRTP
jgi:hypothetical protein